jgi:hypothetical protein
MNPVAIFKPPRHKSGRKPGSSNKPKGSGFFTNENKKDLVFGSIRPKPSSSNKPEYKPDSSSTNQSKKDLIFVSIKSRTISARKMTRLTDDPDASEDDDSGLETKLPIFNEDQALRLLEPMPISDDDVPVFLLENVTVRHPNGKFANALLHSRPGTTIEIIGQLAEVDQQFEHLRK